MDVKSITAEPVKKARSHWHRLTPDRFAIGLLLGMCLLWLSERVQWFGFNQHRGWTVLIALAGVGVTAVAMLLWWAVSLLLRWRFQFGIRSVLGFCLACAIAASWLATEIKRAGRQAEMLKWIEKPSGWVVYDWESYAAKNHIGNPEPPEPRWLRTALGDDFFSTIVTINCDGSTITGARLERMKELTRLRGLYLVQTNITDAELEHLKGMSQLQLLSLQSTAITDAGLEHLKGLTQLRELFLGRTKITDAGLEHLKGLTQLQVLYIDYTNTTDAGLERLKELTQLRFLYLLNTGITDAGLEQIRTLVQLEKLYLDDTNTTDAGLEHLKDLTQLQVLSLYRTKVTDAGVKKLQQALPNCKIEH